MIKVLFAISVFALLIGIVINKTYGQGYNIEVSPAKVNLEVKPGQTYNQTFRIGNYSGSQKTLYFYTRDFTVSDDAGTPIFFEEQDPHNKTFSLTKWVQLSEEELTLEDEEVKEVEVTINVPEDAESGGHYAAFFTQTEKPEDASSTAIGSIGRIASLMLVNVPGDIEENLSLVEFVTDQKYYFSDNPEVKFTTILKNEGNVHAIPTGVVFVSGGSNFKPKNLIYNQEQGAVLPNAPDRKIELSFQPLKSGNFPPFGKMKANLLIKYGSQQYEINDQVEFWLIPAKFTALALVVIVGILFVLWRTIISYRK